MNPLSLSYKQFLVKKKSIQIRLKFEQFPISVNRTLLLKKIEIVLNWPHPSIPLKLVTTEKKAEKGQSWNTIRQLPKDREKWESFIPSLSSILGFKSHVNQVSYLKKSCEVRDNYVGRIFFVTNPFFAVLFNLT